MFFDAFEIKYDIKKWREEIGVGCREVIDEVAWHSQEAREAHAANHFAGFRQPTPILAIYRQRRRFLFPFFCRWSEAEHEGL
jgi:hypothetical protein